MRLIRLTTILLVLNAGCSSLPKAPTGYTCVVDVANNGADCSPISSAVRFRNNISQIKANATIFIPFAQMDNYVAFSPDSWGNIQVYINELKQLANKSCNP